MDALIGTFHIDWRLMVAQIINFGIVFFVLHRYAIKPLLKSLEERKTLIEKGVTDAKENDLLLKNTQEAYDKELAKARAESHELMAEMKKNVEEKRTTLLNETEGQVKSMLDDAKNTIEKEKIQAIDSMKKEIGQLIVTTTEKLVGSGLPSPISSEILDKSISELSKK